MIKWLRDIFRRITGISTPLGGISWNPSEMGVTKVPTFRDPICITSAKNHEFISFLETNNRKIVFLKTYIDACCTFSEQQKIVEKERRYQDLIKSCAFSGVPLPLPDNEGNLVSIIFYFSEDHILSDSAGGTGVITVDINGFFEVSRTIHGATSVFHLKEVKASLKAKFDILNH